MNGHPKPVAGNWYRHLDKGQMFRVIDVDAKEDLIEMQHFDGDVEEIETAEWYAMRIEPAAEPEDWTGPLDDVETDDLGLSETAMKDRDWQESLEANRSPPEPSEEESEAEELYGNEPPPSGQAARRRTR